MQDHNIGDANIERLLETAYSPEPVDPAFATKLEADLCAAAKSAWPGLRYSETPDVAHPLRRLRKRLGWAMALAASVALAFVVYYASTHQGEPLASQQTPESTAAARPISMGLTARPRIEAPAAQPLAVGATVATKASQRRRVTLTDGSVLYLNQNTTVKIEAPRQIDLRQGEIYLEVAPRESAARGLATFLIHTPTRDITALGTRFGVQADPQGPGVIVTQGKVKVSGVNEEIHAGQQLAVRQKVVTEAPRATYLLDWTRELMEAAQSPLVPASNYAGGALLAIDPNGQEVKLTLRKFHIDVYIEDGFARTTIDQTYFNNENGRLEGTFYFPLPPDASLSRLAMYVEDGADSKLMEGGMAERDHARNVFETILHQRRDPALLEWVDGSTFKMRVFPLEGRKEKRILLSYTQSLSSLYGTMQYRFPAGHNMDLVRDWSFQAKIVGKSHEKEERLVSPSHPEMKFTRQGSDIVATAEAQNVKPNRDIVLTLRETDAPQKIAFTAFDHENQHYLMLKYRPDLSFRAREEVASAKRKQRRDWIILFETSANRDPLLARAQIDIIKTLLENVEHDDTFAIITANTRADVFDTNLRPARADYVKDALAYLEQSHLIGALDLSKALAAAKPFLAKATNPYLVHVGAGIAAMGDSRDDANAKRIPDGVRYVGIGVGKRWNRAFMKMAAERSGGLFTQINPDEPIAWRTFEMLATLNTPRLMELCVVDAAEKTIFLTETTAVAQGEEIRAFTRTADKLPEKIIVTGKLNGKPFSHTIAVKDVAAGAGYLPRTWAKLEIDRLLADGADKNKKAVIGLSMAMYVMTPFTSLLVLEKDEDYATYKVDRGRKDHWAMYDSPARIPTVYEGLWGQQVVKAETKDDGKGEVLPKPKNAPKTAEEVLETILVRRGTTQAMTARQWLQGISAESEVRTIVQEYLNEKNGKNKELLGVEGRMGIANSLNPTFFHIGGWGEYDNAFWSQSTVSGSGNTRVITLDKGGAAILAEVLQKAITDIRPNAVNVITPAGNKTRGLAKKGTKPIVITAVGGKMIVTSDDPAALALVTEMTRLFTSNANSPGDFDVVRLKYADARRTATLLDEAFNGRSATSWGLGAGGFTANNVLQGLLPPALSGAPGGSRQIDRIKVTADPATNALVVQASPLDMLVIRKLLDTQLDAGVSDSNQIINSRSLGQVGNPLTGAQRFPNTMPSGPTLRGFRGFWPTGVPSPSTSNSSQLPAPRDSNESPAPRLPVTAEALETLGVVVIRSNDPVNNAPLAIGSYASGLGGQRLSMPGVTIPATTDPIYNNPLAIANSGVSHFPYDNLGSRGGAGAIGGVGFAGQGRGFADVDGSITGLLAGQWTPRAHTNLTGGIIGGKLRKSNDLRLQGLAGGHTYGWDGLDLIYKTPQFNVDQSFFSDLIAFAPGLHTTTADIQATVEAEATAEKLPLTGKIPDEARKLIDRARSAGWQTLTNPSHGRIPSFKLLFNGAGQHAYERIFETGLHEQVICDGTTLLSLYPEIGLGGRRPFSRHHQEEFAAKIPWYLSKAEDLARGADLELVDGATVAVIPHQIAAKNKEAKSSLALHLVFAKDGRLAERRIIEMTSGKALVRQTYAADGTVKTINAKEDKVVSETRLSIAKCEAPNLQADTKDLLVMEFPVRTPEFFSNNPSWKGSFAQENGKVMEQYFVAACLSGRTFSSPLQMFAQRFHSQGDNRLGFYTMLNHTGRSFSPDDYAVLNGLNYHFNIEKEYPNNALAIYLANEQKRALGLTAWSLESLPGPKDGLIQQLARFASILKIWNVWISDDPSQNAPDKVRSELSKALDFIKSTKSPLYAWTILDVIMHKIPVLDDDFNQALTTALKDLQDQYGLDYFPSYENARNLLRRQKNAEAVQEFQKLYIDTFQSGILPPLDADFVRAFRQSAVHEDNPFSVFMHQRLDELLKDKQLSAATLLAWQSFRLGQIDTANGLFERIVAGASAKYKTVLQLIYFEYLNHSGQFERADNMLQQILTDPMIARNPVAWRFSGTLAQKRGNLARSAAALEKALDLEFKDLPDVINLAPLRDDYRQLLNHYQQVAAAVTVLETGASSAGGSEYLNPGHALRQKELLARVVKAADRWRSLDPENMEVCQLTGRILRTMGAKDLAWDYLTTPIGMKPNESAPWLGLADALHQEADYELADRAYAAAFEAEPTNPDILRKRAINFESMNRFDQSEQLNMQIRTGNWQPRFQGFGGGFGGGAGALGGGGFGGGAGFGGGGFGGGAGAGGGFGGGAGGGGKGGGGGGKGGGAKGG